MITENNLRELIGFSASEPVLSIYLNTEPSQGNTDAHRLRLKNFLKKVDLPEDQSAIDHYISHTYDWSGRGVAIFSCAPRNFFRAYPLAVPVPNLVYVSDRPGVKPLATLFDNFGGYGVVLLDKQGARLFFFHLGELAEQEGYLGDEVKHTKSGGASAVPGRRGGTAGQTHYVEEVVDRNIKGIIQFAIHFFESNHIRRILIGGTDDNIALFRTQLPKAWQSLIVGTFAMPMTASHHEVLNKAMQVGLETERLREEYLVEEVITSQAKGGSAVVGLETTLQEINQDRVQSLLIIEGLRKTGYRCTGCDMLTTQPAAICAGCGEGIERVQDVVDLAISKVMRHKGEIEVIQSSPALEQLGGMAAFLRY